MRSFFKIALVATAVAALALDSIDLSAQSRGSNARSSSGTVSRSSDGNSSRPSGSSSPSSGSSYSRIGGGSSPQSTSRAQGGTVRSGSSSSRSSGGSYNRNPGSGSDRPSYNSGRNTGADRPTGSPAGSGATRSSGSSYNRSSGNRPDNGSATRSSGYNYYRGTGSHRGYNSADSYNRQTQGPDDIRFNHHGDRVHPHSRPYMEWDRPGRFYGRDPHYFGYRVRYLPHYRRVSYWGIDYYFYNDIWYRWWDGAYVVCRPPYGVGFAYDLYDLELDVLRFSYYNQVYRDYRTIDANYSTILEQNRTIAENNATIAAQNAAIAARNAEQSSSPSVDMNTLKSIASYNLAAKLGLVQSYAASDSEYYYDDGVFFVKGNDGKYKTIVPPAGALIKALPDDYETVTLSDGNEYYKVDDTIFRMSVTDGVPYFEVLGQTQSNTVVVR